MVSWLNGKGWELWLTLNIAMKMPAQRKPIVEQGVPRFPPEAENTMDLNKAKGMSYGLGLPIKGQPGADQGK